MTGKWPAVRDEVRGRISGGALGPGAVASVRDLAAELGVGEGVVARALAVLARDGLLETVPGVGYVVARPVR